MFPFKGITLELSGAALPHPMEHEARNEPERFVMDSVTILVDSAGL